jgi:hypothetical protein
MTSVMRQLEWASQPGDLLHWHARGRDLPGDLLQAGQRGQLAHLMLKLGDAV